MTPLYIDSDAIQRQLSMAAFNLQTYFVHQEGSFYPLEDLQKVLVGWLELSIEALVEDAVFHTVEGDRAQAFNRSAFENQMKHLQPRHPAQAPTKEQTLPESQPQSEAVDSADGEVVAA